MLAIPADQVPEVVESVCRDGSARAIVLIPGGLGETTGSQDRVVAVRESLETARRLRGWAPLINGGNCLGVRSKDGPVDTLFIPRHKMPHAEGTPDPVALVSQSGAFAVARVSSLAPLNPRVVATVGNQLDVTVGDYVEYLATDSRLTTLAVYVEGFAEGDGLRFLRAVRTARRSGKAVILYRAGRSRAGREASASHTASMAGDYQVTCALAEGAGAIVVDSIEDFDDMVRLSVALAGRPILGPGLVAVSNAGFECVALADHSGGLDPVRLHLETVARLEKTLETGGLAGITRPGNPMDLTPMMGAGGFSEVIGILLNDPAAQIGIVGCVPLTGALETLPAGETHDEDLSRPGGLVDRLSALWEETSQAWVVVVDAGSQYNPLVRRLGLAGIPVFRHADRAVRSVDRYVTWRRFGESLVRTSPTV